MKLLLNLLRTAVFMVVIYYFMYVVILAFGWLSRKLFDIADYGQEHLNAFAFWLITIFLVCSILGLIWYLFKIIMGFILSWLARICPYRTFATWFTGIVASVYCIFFLIGFWFESSYWSFLAVIIGIILTICCIQMCFMAVKSIIIGYETMDEVEVQLAKEEYYKDYR